MSCFDFVAAKIGTFSIKLILSYTFQMKPIRKYLETLAPKLIYQWITQTSHILMVLATTVLRQENDLDQWTTYQAEKRPGLRIWTMKT